MRSKDLHQGNQLKAMIFSADNIVLQTSGLNTSYNLLRLSVTSTRQRYTFIAAMIEPAGEQNWIQVQQCISSQRYGLYIMSDSTMSQI